MLIANFETLGGEFTKVRIGFPIVHTNTNINADLVTYFH